MIGKSSDVFTADLFHSLLGNPIMSCKPMRHSEVCLILYESPAAAATTAGCNMASSPPVDQAPI